MSPARFGFVGLGAMGGPMAANIAAAGFDLIVYDKAGTEARTPGGARAAASLAEVGGAAETVFL
ncbi:MAG: NAD(P)-dependent oxidoreductase, partial [Proteobacteria bacterium]|nr:NAD(P)-dependent oxidoreductase [Pseudomonadota bacterium]